MEYVITDPAYMSSWWYNLLVFIVFIGFVPFIGFLIWLFWFAPGCSEGSDTKVLWDANSSAWALDINKLNKDK